jgi:UDP-glucose 4-epimerase
MTSVLVTGGAGFIGSHLSMALAEKGCTVTVVDNLDPYYSISLKRKNATLLRESSCTFVKGDITDEGTVKNLLDDVDYVFHLAARPGVRASIEDPMVSCRINIEGTLNLLKASLNSDIRRFINASSSSVYGTVKYLPFDEEHPTRPLSPYGVSKLVAEHYCRVFHHVHNLPTVSLRYFTVYGPRMRPDLAIPIFTKAMIEGKPQSIFGNGEQTRDFTFVDDIVRGNVSLLNSSEADGQVLNIGSGKRITVNTLLHLLGKVTGTEPNPDYVDEMIGDAKHTLANVEKAGRLIDYKPRIDIEEGLRRYLEWYGNGSFYVE